MRYCNYETVFVDEGVSRKWDVTTDCGMKVRMYYGNKWWKLHQRTLAPHPTGTLLGVKCPNCAKEVNFFNPMSETSWRILPPKGE